MHLVDDLNQVAVRCLQCPQQTTGFIQLWQHFMIVCGTLPQFGRPAGTRGSAGGNAGCNHPST